MDITKVTADILDGPNWGTWAVQIQAAARVLNCWSVMKGERIAGVSPPTYDLLLKPVHGNAAGQISDLALFTKSLSEWNKMNSTALGLIQGKLNPALWPDYVDVGDAATFWTHLETKYGKAGGANTYLQFVGMIKQTFSDSSVTLKSQRTSWFSCSVLPSLTHTKTPPANISITSMILQNINCS